jgi:hypothetical protein
MMILFYTLSFLSGFFEIGPLMMILNDRGAAAAIMAAVCYQAGNLVPRPLYLSRGFVLALGILSAGFFSLAFLLPVKTLSLVSLFIGTALISAVIQSARSGMKSGAPKMLKRGTRAAGFALGFFCSLPLAAAGAVAVAGIAACCLFRSPASSGKTRFTLPAFSLLNITMIFHQMHYFVYCYAMYIAFRLSGSAFTAMSAFLISWAVYVLSPLLYKKAKNYRNAFFLGHSLLAGILAALYFVPDLRLKIVLWTLTGVGGTTEFCIGALAGQRLDNGNEAMGFSENCGHVLGVVVCLIIVLAGFNLYITSLLAAGFAITAILFMALSTRGEI